MALIDDIKKELRITSIAFDSEVQDLIDAAEEDLKQSGVVNVDETNTLIKRAIALYCKGYFGYDNPDADRFINAFKSLEIHMALSSDFNTAPVVI